MIKELKKYQIKLTPFTTAKTWFLDNTVNEDLILTEDGDTLALQFIDYGSGNPLDDPIRNDSCSLALEQQSPDEIKYREGLKVTGIFYPDIDPQNVDGTYKRLVYSQLKTTFYNGYRDPTKLWGLESIDFEIAQTKRYLTDELRLFDVPQLIFGEKIVEKSVEMFDNTIDDFFNITDDGYGNLIASKNLFSRFQEVPDYPIVLESGSDYYCGTYLIPKLIELTSGGDYASANVGLLSGSLTQTVYSASTTFNVGLFGGSTASWAPNDSGSFDVGLLCGSLNDTIVIRSGSDSASFSLRWNAGSFGSETFEDATGNFELGLSSGSINIQVISQSSPPETQSIDISWFGGSIINVISAVTQSGDSGSFNAVFTSGSCQTVVSSVSMSAETASVTLTFFSGSVWTTVTSTTQAEGNVPINVGLSSGSIDVVA